MGSHTITNEDLSKFLDTNHEWIVSRTGIEERPIMGQKETLLELARKASLEALNKIHLNPQDLDVLVVATSGGDETFPPLGVSLAQSLGASSSVMAFDMNVACSGYLYALEVTKSLLNGRWNAQNTQNKKPLHGLVVGAECMSRLVSWEDRSTAVLFGDGAGATVLTVDMPQEKPLETRPQGIVDSVFYTLPKGRDALYVSDWSSENDHEIEGHEEDILQYLQHGLGPKSSYRQRGTIHMKGQEVFRHAVLFLEKIGREILEKNHLSIEDVTWVIPHQANKRILEALGQRLGIDSQRLLYTGSFHGNISAASIPITMNHFWNKGYFSKGNVLLFQSFGAGFTCGATLVVL